MKEGANLSSESDGENALRIRLRVCQPNGRPFENDRRYYHERKYEVNYSGEPINGSHDTSTSKYGTKERKRSSRQEKHKVNGISDVHSETDSDILLENPKSVDSLDGPFDGTGGMNFNPEPVPRKRTYTSSSANSDSEGITRRPSVIGRKRGRRASRKSASDEFGNLDEIEGMQCGIYLTGPEDNHNENLVDPKRIPENFNPLDLVWAKCRGYPSYPAMVSSYKSSSSWCLAAIKKRENNRVASARFL